MFDDVGIVMLSNMFALQAPKFKSELTYFP